VFLGGILYLVIICVVQPVALKTLRGWLRKLYYLSTGKKDPGQITSNQALNGLYEVDGDSMFRDRSTFSVGTDGYVFKHTYLLLYIASKTCAFKL
jgi:hypothetical protein